MLQIPCPWCGLRDEDEFRYGGEAIAARPALDAGDACWSAYLFARTNTRGEHDERWGHAYGCGRWFNVRRDTITHDIIATRPLSTPHATVGTGEDATPPQVGRREVAP